jgi:regulator of sirC expression with transglutaminase-like and TPR domain
MQFARQSVAAIALIAAACARVACGDEPENERIARLIAQLDADTFEVRERASRELAEIGRPALPALEAARTHKSPEVRGRAKAIIDSLTSGLRRREFTEFASQPDETLDLEHGMWLISRILHPEVKKQDLSKQLDALAGKVRERLGKGIEPATADPAQLVAALREELFVEQGFTGNTADYRNPDNSSLARVLATRKGLPILLSHVTVAVGRRLRAPIVPLGLDGTYIVKYDGSRSPAGFAKDDIFLHPFYQGRLIARENIDIELPGKDALNEPPDDARTALVRMLQNMINHLAEREEHEKLEQAQELQNMLKAYAREPELP